MTDLRLILLLLTITTPVSATHLTNYRLENSQQVIAAYQSASAADAQTAAQQLTKGDAAMQRRNWSAAFKHYAEATLARPSAAAFVGMALALAHIERPQPDHVAAFTAKLRDFAEALHYFSLAVELQAVSNEAVPLSDVYKQLLAVQARIACASIGDVTSWSSPCEYDGGA